ncbi:MAG: orotidine-5'-phosphate decarboxylase [Planctomycetes bacterium]|nr:orotidine-5'-phosphate decarboxylase [Planctomycetota bacterium]
MNQSAAVAIEPDRPNPLSNAADRLLEAIERAGSPVCVGIDPVIDGLPKALRPGDDTPAAAVRAIEAFTRGVLEAVAPHVPCVKFQSACFERYRHLGVQALYGLMGEARQRGLVVVLDAKRGDIGVSAEHYAAAAFDPWPATAGDDRPDWLTINSYFGPDGIVPFLRRGHGVFALVRTSNPGGDAVQGRSLADGQPVAVAVAEMIASIGEAEIGERGYSALGAVVGAARPEAARKLREAMPRQIFLVPGFGAQGGRPEDVLACFDRDRSGAMVTASRSVIYAFDRGGGDWTNSVSAAAESFADEIARAVGLR